MKQFALMFVLAGFASVGCNPVKAADPEPTRVKALTKSAGAVPVAVPAAIPAAAPADVPAEVAVVPGAAAVEPASAATGVPKKAATPVLSKGKASASSDRPRSGSKKGGEVTSF